MSNFFEFSSPQSSHLSSSSSRSSSRKLKVKNTVYHDILSYLSKKADISEQNAFDTPLFVCQQSEVADITLDSQVHLQKSNLNISQNKTPYGFDEEQTIEDWEKDLLFQNQESLAKICMLLLQLQKHKFLPPKGFERRALNCLKESYDFINRQIYKDYNISAGETDQFKTITVQLYQQAFEEISGQQIFNFSQV